jgi:hypothetical protein
MKLSRRLNAHHCVLSPNQWVREEDEEGDEKEEEEEECSFSLVKETETRI